MPSRRQFLRGGLGAVAAGLLARPQLALGLDGPLILRGLPQNHPNPCPPTGALPVQQTRPIVGLRLAPESVVIDGLPFSATFTGDNYAFADFPFHTSQNSFPGGRPPDPTEDVPVVIVGGGLSGLTVAYLLRAHNPVLLELRDRFGGVSAGETWGGTPYSLGGAYFITPDEGSFLESFYHELGLDQVVRVDEGGFEVELNGRIDPRFMEGKGWPPDERDALRRYIEVVRSYTENYPDIPLPDRGDTQWIRELDRKTLKQDIEQKMGVPVPPRLAAAIQAYCYSSFGAGWEELSAAGGWNFLAAEEFGRWVLPGGNTYLVDQLWNRLTSFGITGVCGGRNLRGRCRVVDIRFVEGRRTQVTYRDAAGQFRSLLARKVVVCSAKMIAKYMIHRLDVIDRPKYEAMHNMQYAAYVVANVLLDQTLHRDFYDIFLLGNGDFPMSPAAFEAGSRVVDMLNGHFARQEPVPRSVLTLYWPLPWASARFTLLDDNAWQNYAESIAPQIRSMLGVLNVPVGSVRQVRLTRWGHAMPISRPGFIADGTADHVRRPMEGMIWFVNQDNWALPAVENCLLDAQQVAEQVRRGL